MNGEQSIHRNQQNTAPMGGHVGPPKQCKQKQTRHPRSREAAMRAGKKSPGLIKTSLLENPKGKTKRRGKRAPQQLARNDQRARAAHTHAPNNNKNDKRTRPKQTRASKLREQLAKASCANNSQDKSANTSRSKLREQLTEQDSREQKKGHKW